MVHNVGIIAITPTINTAKIATLTPMALAVLRRLSVANDPSCAFRSSARGGEFRPNLRLLLFNCS